MSNESTPLRVSVSEAAKLLGLSTKSIRDAIRNQEFLYIVVRNRYKINFESLLHWSQASVRRSNKLASEGLGRYVDNWKLSAKKYSPRAPQRTG